MSSDHGTRDYVFGWRVCFGGVFEALCDLLDPCRNRAEDRPSLLRFNEEFVGEKCRHIRFVDGNDPCSIDVGIMSKSGSRSARFDRTSMPRTRPGSCSRGIARSTRWSRRTALICSFLSTTSRASPEEEARKPQEAGRRVRQIVDRLIGEGKHVIVLGDLNEGLDLNV